MTEETTPPAKRARKAKPLLKVFFDTNVLYTQAASDLVMPPFSEFIKRNSAFSDI